MLSYHHVLDNSFVPLTLLSILWVVDGHYSVHFLIWLLFWFPDESTVQRDILLK